MTKQPACWAFVERLEYAASFERTRQLSRRVSINFVSNVLPASDGASRDVSVWAEGSALGASAAGSGTGRRGPMRYTSV